MTSDRPDGPASQSSGPNPPARWQDALPRVVAFALYAVLLDAAVETWWSGSPVRWWVVGAVAIYAAATTLLWRRITWRSKATISAFVFLGVVAITAWLPGGLSAGMRIAGGETSTLLSLLTAAAVVLAAVVVWRFRALPTAVRTGVGLLAAYGLTAFVYGAVTGVPFSALFSGDSVWQRLPALLQGAFVGGLIVLPLALLTSVVRAGIPRFREGSPRYALYQIVALATSLAIVLAALPVASQWRNDSRAGTAAIGFSVPVTTPIVPSPALSDALENSLRAIADGERESPRDRWDTAYVVEHVGKDPQQLFEWVAGNTFWIPYRGLLRGPVGVLMDRMGNSLDRAVLLATLLKQAGHSVRLAHGELAANRAMGLLPALIVARTGGMVRERRLKPIDAGEVRQGAARYSLDGPAIEQSLGSHAADGNRVFSSLDVRVADQTTRLRAAVGGRLTTDDLSARLDSAINLLRDHWWVQRQDGGSWVDLDLLSLDMRALTNALETVALGGVNTSQLHQVIVRVVAEQWNDGKVAERIALQHALKPAELIGKPIVLGFWPRRWPSKVNPGPNPRQYMRTTALAQHEWVATLQIGRDTAAQSSLLENGDINDHPMMNNFAKIGGSAAGAADDVASLLGGLTPEQTQRSDKKTMLTAAWLEFEIRTPGEPSRTSRHTVFDLLGPTARAARPVVQVGLDDAASLLRGLSLMMDTEILPIACRIAPEFYRHLAAESLLGNREILRALVRGEISDTTTRPEELGARLAPVPGPLYPLAIARFDRSRVSDQIYVVSPNVLTRHVFPAPAGGDRITLRDATDIVANEVGVDLHVKDAFAVRFEQGVFDTNAEAHLQPGSTVVGSPANAFAASNDWVTLTSANDPQFVSLRFSDDDRRRITQDLAEGSVVVAPRGPVRVGSDEFVGWWRIDPARGHVLGVDSRGWGPTFAEYMTVFTVAMTGFYVMWLMCKVPPPRLPGAPDVAGGYVPGLDQVVAPLAAAVSPCLAEGINGAILGAMLGVMAISGGSGASGAGGGKGGSGGGGSGGGGHRKGWRHREWREWERGGTGAGGGTGGSGGGSAGGGGGNRSAGSGRADVDQFGNTQRGADPLGKTQRGADPIGKTQRGADPLGKTERGADPLQKTDPAGRGGTDPKTDGNARPPAESPQAKSVEVPDTGAQAPEDLASAKEAAKSAAHAAEAESFEAGSKWLEYRNRQRTGDPTWDQGVDDKLFSESELKSEASVKAINNYRAVGTGAGQPVGRGGGLAPPNPAPKPPAGLPGCPPNCGNENKTGPAQDVQVSGLAKSVVGAAGVNKVLGGK